MNFMNFVKWSSWNLNLQKLDIISLGNFVSWPSKAASASSAAIEWWPIESSPIVRIVTGIVTQWIVIAWIVIGLIKIAWFSGLCWSATKDENSPIIAQSTIATKKFDKSRTSLGRFWVLNTWQGTSNRFHLAFIICRLSASVILGVSWKESFAIRILKAESS